MTKKGRTVLVTGGGTGLGKAGNTLSLTSPVALANGGTGQVTAAAALTALTGAQSAGAYVRSNGTSAALSAIQAADLRLEFLFLSGS